MNNIWRFAANGARPSDFLTCAVVRALPESAHYGDAEKNRQTLARGKRKRAMFFLRNRSCA
jgi:hypothetical protein